MTGVVVLGDGLAASMAALAAARAEPSASVTLVSPPDREPATAATSPGPVRPVEGLVGLLGYTPGGEGPLAEPFGAIPDLPADHPYRLVGTDAVREGLALFDDVTGGAYGGESTERNALVPTAWGRLRPTARYPDTLAAGLASDRLATSLVGFDTLPRFDPALAAERLDERLPYRVNGLTVGFPAAVSGGTDPPPIDRTPLDCAQAFDAAETIEGLCEELDVFLDAKDRVGFPAILGMDHADRVRERLTDALGLDVFEVPLGPPSIPGIRLGTLLADALVETGVDVTAATIEGVEASDGRIEAVRLDGETPHPGEAFVLATGGLVKGGLVADRNGVRESVTGCHVEAPASRTEWADADPLGEHAFARFGVSVDECLRPLTSRGHPEFENLRAAGRLIGGYDFVAEGSAGGVSIATGAVAGRLTAESL